MIAIRSQILNGLPRSRIVDITNLIISSATRMFSSPNNMQIIIRINCDRRRRLIIAIRSQILDRLP